MIKKKVRLFTALMILVLLSQPALAESARQLNTRGFRLYKQKKYEEALHFFREAARADPNYAMAHYNIACTLGVFRKLRDVCAMNAYRGTIMYHLKKSVELDPRRGERMKTDSDLDPIRDTFSYQILAGLDFKKESDLKLILQRVTWYGPGAGVHGPIFRLNFKKNGQVILHFKDMNSENFRWKKEKGTYLVTGTKISLSIKNSEGKAVDAFGSLNAKGELLFQNGLPRKFTDDPEDCSA